MGFNPFKAIGKVFKKIGKGIKSAFGKFGKFMNKIGIVGQIAMGFILPGIGQALSNAFSSVVGQTAAQATASATAAVTAGTEAATAAAAAGTTTAAQTAAIEAGKVATAKLGTTGIAKATGMAANKFAIVRGAGTLIRGAANFAGQASNVYSNITQGITDFLGNVGKKFVNAFGADFKQVPIFGEGGRFEKLSNLTQDPSKFGKVLEKAVEEVVTINPKIDDTTQALIDQTTTNTIDASFDAVDATSTIKTSTENSLLANNTEQGFVREAYDKFRADLPENLAKAPVKLGMNTAAGLLDKQLGLMPDSVYRGGNTVVLGPLDAASTGMGQNNMQGVPTASDFLEGGSWGYNATQAQFNAYNYDLEGLGGGYNTTIRA
tara:strand:+ start:563 stop:1693 length:1131 start_codon:yes stop_codon:yes gene_type:complete